MSKKKKKISLVARFWENFCKEVEAWMADLCQRKQEKEKMRRLMLSI